MEIPNHRWAFGAICLMLALVAGLYARVAADIGRDWLQRSEYSYCVLVFPLTVYFGFRRFRATMSILSRVDARGLVLIVLGCLAFVSGQLGSEYFTTRASLIVLLGGMIWTFGGVERLRALGLPLTLLATLIPLPDIFYNRVAGRVQLFISEAAIWLIQAIGGSIDRDADTLRMPKVSISVAEACSGLHSLPTLLALVSVVAGLYLFSIQARVTLVVAAAFTAILLNILRIATVGVLANHGVSEALAPYDFVSGWLLIGMDVVIVWILARVMSTGSGTAKLRSRR